MSLRVHGGEAGGRRLRTPRGIRPTQGMVKEAIFNALGPAVAGARVLDLFAGSGGLGIEALSRGAAEVTFVERSGACVSILRQNLDALGYAHRTRTVRSDVARWLAAHQQEAGAASIVLLDPPYGDPVLGLTLAALDRIAGSATVVVEHGRRDRLPALERLRETRSRVYGDTAVTFLKPA